MQIALLLFGAWAAAVISGIAGFGGALLLLPLLVRVVGIEAAVPLLTIAQLCGNVARVVFGWKQIRWCLAGAFLFGAIPGAFLGSMLFVTISPVVVKKIIAALLVILVIARRSGLISKPWPVSVLAVSGAVVGFISGLAGSAGPLGAAVFLSLRLPPVAYVATEAVTAIGMHITKTAVYAFAIRFPPARWSYGAALGTMMILGTWNGRRLVERLDRRKFLLLVDALLLVSAFILLLNG